MAVTAPLNLITSKPALAAIAISISIETAKQLMMDKVNEIIKDADKLSRNIKCTDPRVIKVKQSLNQINDAIEQINSVIEPLSQIIAILTVAAQVASTIATAALANPLPTISAVEESRTLQKELVANILAAIAQISLTLTGTIASLRSLLKILVPVIDRLSAICNDQDIPVTGEYENVNRYLNDLNTLNLESKFYQLYNVSQPDIDLREDLIIQLQEQQRSLLDLLEAPSRVIVAENTNELPAVNQGKQGDFFIDIESRTIYGPKSSDTEWGTPVIY
jgi:hypothetical protein